MDKRTIVAIALVVLLVPAVALAQSNFDLRYDPQSVITISGRVLTTIDYHPGNPSMGPKAVVVQSDGRIYKVFLGPGWYIDQIGFRPTSGQTISVTGSRRNVSGDSYLVARSIATPSGTYALRSVQGHPMWSQMVAPPPPIGMESMIVPRPPVGAGPSDGMPLARIPFNPDTIMEVSGKIRELYAMRTAEDNEPMVVAVIEDEKVLGNDRFYHVILAPLSFLTQNGISLQSGNTLFVRGSKIPFGGREVLVASNVEEGENMISLRTEWGAALFAPLTLPIGAGPGQQVPLVSFDQNNMVEVSGKIRDIYLMQTAEDNVPCVVATIEDEKLVGDDRIHHVLLGPQSFLTANGINLNRDNTLFVQGSKVRIGDRDIIVATNLEEGEKTISLRTNTGVALFPVFTGPSTLVPSPPSR